MGKLKFTSNFSIICYFLNFTLAQLILTIPFLYAKIVGNAGPILSIYTFLILFVFMFILYKLYKPFVGKNIFDISDFVGSKILKKITCMFYIVIFTLMSMIFLRQMSESIKILLFNTSPITYITSFFIIAMILGSLSGLEGIIRASGYIVPICIFSILLTLAFSSQFFKIERLSPILGNGVKTIFLSGFERVTGYIGISFIFIFASLFSDMKSVKKTSFYYIFISFILIFLCVTANVLVFAYPYISGNLFSLYEMANLTNLNSFFQRTEILFILCFVLICFLFLISTFHALVYSFTELINYKVNSKNKISKKNIIISIILGIIVFYISLIPKNLIQTIELTVILKNTILIPLGFIYPLILMIVARIKYSRNRGAYEKSVINSN